MISASRTDWLPDYLIEVRQLLHDASASYFSDSELAGYINEGRRKVAVDTGCLRQIQTITLPAGQETFAIGGVYPGAAPVPAPTGGTPPYTLQSGYGGAGNFFNTTVPGTIAVTTTGLYYQAPGVSFLSPAPITVSAAAALTNGLPISLPYAITLGNVYVVMDMGEYNANNITPTVIFQSVGVAAQTTVVDGNLTISSPGSGQIGGVVIVDSAATPVVTDPGAGAFSILDARIASIDQMTVIWGSQRVPMWNYAYTDFSIVMRGLVGFQYIPTGFAMTGNSLHIGPIPNQAFQYELDCILYPLPLVALTQTGEIADSSAIDCVKYYASYLARASQGNDQEASGFLALYGQAVDSSVNRPTTRLSQPLYNNE